MVTQQSNQHPNETQGLDVDAPNPNPNPALQGEAPEPGATSFGGAASGKMKCTNRSTGAFVGYLASSGNNVCLSQDAAGGETLSWCPYGSDLYLRRSASPSDRYLGLGWNGYACWGLWTPTGWVNAIVYNKADGTISLKGDEKRKLYGPYGNGWVCWSDGEDNQNILTCELEA